MSPSIGKNAGSTVAVAVMCVLGAAVPAEAGWPLESWGPVCEPSAPACGQVATDAPVLQKDGLVPTQKGGLTPIQNDGRTPIQKDGLAPTKPGGQGALPAPADAKPAPTPPASKPTPPPAIKPKQGPAEPPPAAKAPKLPAPPPPGGTPPADKIRPVLPTAGTDSSAPGSAVLMVSVPEDARVFVNGNATRTQGTQRRYVSRGLEPGFAYRYEVRVEVEREGRMLTDQRVVRLWAGQNADLAFALGRPDPNLVATTLTLHVPETATVKLAGNATSATGRTRQFTTTALAPGETWEAYRVEIAVERDGHPLVRATTLTLVGGQSHELRVDLPGERFAQR